MALQSITNINVDFYDKKYISINAKQHDKNSRFLSITCYNHGEIYPINAGEHSAYIRYRKSDNHSVFNSCEIKHTGKILVELTEQMLASDGVCYADLVIVNKGGASVDAETGEIVYIDDASILSTMTIHINVSATAVDNSDIESSYEFDGLNVALQKAEAEYTEVINMSKSYAVGNAGGIRKNEDTDNAKYYCELSTENQTSAAASELSAANSATAAAISESNALNSANRASASEASAESSATSAQTSEANAKASEKAARGYATTAQNSFENASSSAQNAADSAESAHNYYLQVEAMTNSLNGAFLPMGTCEFERLAILKEANVVATGYLYHISENFITDNTFKTGEGIEFPAGTNVYYTADGYWDCLSGMTVFGVKGDNEANYRKGNVNITAVDVGAIPSVDIATVDEMKNYLGI